MFLIAIHQKNHSTTKNGLAPPFSMDWNKSHQCVHSFHTGALTHFLRYIQHTISSVLTWVGSGSFARLLPLWMWQPVYQSPLIMAKSHGCKFFKCTRWTHCLGPSQGLGKCRLSYPPFLPTQLDPEEVIKNKLYLLPGEELVSKGEALGVSIYPEYMLEWWLICRTPAWVKILNTIWLVCSGGGLVAQSCLTLIPLTIVHQAPLSLRFPRQEYWSVLLFPSPGDLPDTGIEPLSPSLQVDSLSSSKPPGKPSLG